MSKPIGTGARENWETGEREAGCRWGWHGSGDWENHADAFMMEMGGGGGRVQYCRP